MLYTKLNLSTFHLIINHVNNNQCHFNTSYDNHNSAILFHTAVAEISIYSDEADFLFPGNATTEGYSTEIYPMNLPDIKKKPVSISVQTNTIKLTYIFQATPLTSPKK